MKVQAMKGAATIHGNCFRRNAPINNAITVQMYMSENVDGCMVVVVCEAKKHRIYWMDGYAALVGTC